VTVVKHLTPVAERSGGEGIRGGKPEQRRQIAALIEACAKGDRAAFRRLYDLSARFLFGIIIAILRDRELAEEVAQEVFVTIWKNAGAFDAEKGNPLTWMSAVARNRAIDRLRAERARGFVSFSDEVPDLADDDHVADATPDALALRKVLAELRPEYRQALLLTYFHGYTHAELATVLNVPVGTAKSWVRRGLTALKEALQ
jgi:RNA polymerase sigma-70 factor (ECF subfamily)